MISIQFEEEEKLELDNQRFNHPHPKVQRKIEAIYLKSHSLPHNLICQVCHISEPTLVRYLRAYQKGGLEALNELGYKGRSNGLKPHAASLEEQFNQHPPRSVAEAQKMIEESTGIHRGLTQVRSFLHSLGMKYRKTGFVPGKSDTLEKQAEQEEFLKKKLDPALAEAKAGKMVVLSVDAVHFIYGVFLSYLWSMTRRFVRSPSGRQRFNVLGALDVVTHQMHTICNSTYITATTVCELLDKLAIFYAPQKLPITIFLDNAAYQRCELVCAHAQSLGIALEFLPTYSPNLNLIERYWKWVKKEALNSKYHPTFFSMKTAIQDTIENGYSRHAEKLQSLLSWRFQLFTNYITI